MMPAPRIGAQAHEALKLGLDQGTRYPEYRNRTGTILEYRNRTGTGLPRTGTGPEPALGPEGTRNAKRGPFLPKIWLLLKKNLLLISQNILCKSFQDFHGPKMKYF